MPMYDINGRMIFLELTRGKRPIRVGGGSSRQVGRLVLSTDILIYAVAEGSENFFRKQQVQKLGCSTD